MKNIDEDIKTGQFKTVYLLYGEEAYLVKQYKDKLKSALTKEGDNMNVSFFEGANIDVGKIIDLSETLPFFAEKRVIFADDTGLFKGKKNAADDDEEEETAAPEDNDGEDAAAKGNIVDYIKHIPESSVIIFTEKKVDKRNKLYKAISGCGRAVEFKRISPDMMRAWIRKRLNENNINMKTDAYELFIANCGMDMLILSNELEKLMCYVAGRDVITVKDVEAICTVQIEDKIFDMLNAVADHNKKLALKLYDDLLVLKTPPAKILSMLVGQFNRLYQVKLLKKDGNSADMISDKVGLRAGYVTKLYIDRSAKFKESVLREALEECIELEELIKSGRMNDKMSVELIIVKYSDISLQK